MTDSSTTMPDDPSSTAPIPLPEGPEGITWRPVSPDDVDALVELSGLVADADHPEYRATRDEIVMAQGFSFVDLARDTIVAVDADGRLAAEGVAIVKPDEETAVRANVSGSVRPDLRRRGIGGRLLDWQIARATRTLAVAQPAPHITEPVPTLMGSEVQVGSAGHVALLESRGFTPSRYFIEMHRDLQTELPDVPAPEGLRLIPVTREWWERTRLAKNEVFRDHWGSEPVSVERWDAYRSLPTARDDLSVIAVTGEGEDAVVAGFAMAETYPDSWEAAGYTSTYIALVGVRREFRGRRLAQAILSASLAGSRAEGVQRAVLDVDSDSPTGALDLYEHLGFTQASRSAVYEREVGLTPPRGSAAR
ncbi:GNAT family N-acetyltransferase [Clavibacter michiganensis]|uniref:GNAT family N-acetyltransferase n=1 Tax=Clavibacter michiganensis TaxID=28447 RepID=UPI001D09D232|nr:GNAT family N-acetyltransferase [Clavibacter michiganensis]MDO4016959.1 GNAT family N-acetyltransferase [Clavibacter michiganensis]MDO4024672.1 GNAT family N-acetyltransferase [Clavibacter michiganensis]MDO4034059.1 GNAT family N-acetyltransferase [Clavibacter michiganensis]MDO4037215.1 GNAT family N-acetyltransferase [Clavibacter michiganensis]MDO4046005.1 GNAT family N-acetyltransferase [Clavibacter michiganensis]